LNPKVLPIMLLCLLTISMTYGAMVILSDVAVEQGAPEPLNHVVSHQGLNQTTPQMGDPKGGDGWP
jgi:hypothetical protein